MPLGPFGPRFSFHSSQAFQQLLVLSPGPWLKILRCNSSVSGRQWNSAIVDVLSHWHPKMMSSLGERFLLPFFPKKKIPANQSNFPIVKSPLFPKKKRKTLPAPGIWSSTSRIALRNSPKKVAAIAGPSFLDQRFGAKKNQMKVKRQIPVCEKPWRHFEEKFDG